MQKKRHMKRLFKICVIAILLLCSGKMMAQKKNYFSGTVKFSIEDKGDFDPQKLANAPKENTETIKGNFTRSTQDLGGAFRHTINLVDSTVILLDIPTEKMAISVPASTTEKSLEKLNFDIKKREDTKTICGYVCQGYDITISRKEGEEDDDDEDEGDNSPITFLVYTTEEIGIDENINRSTCPGLKGYVLYQEQPVGEGKIVITEAVEVKKKKVSDFDFMIPTNYKYYTPEAFAKHMRELQGMSGDDEDEDF